MCGVCLPEICTLDCGTMNFAEADYVMTNTPGMLRAMGGMMTALGVKPEIEAFDTGHLWFAKQLVSEGVLKPDALVQLCMGIPVGRAGRSQHLHGDGQQRAEGMELVGLLHRPQPDGLCRGGGAGRRQCPRRLEDNLWLDKGVLATNAQLVERAVTIIENMGARVIGPEEVRKKLNLTKRAPLAAAA